MNSRFTGILFLIIISISFKAEAQQTDKKYPIIPYPTSLIAGNGSFVVTRTTTIVNPSSILFRNEAEILNHYFINSFGKPLRLTKTPGAHSIIMNYDATITALEGYKLVITPQQVTISAKTPAGMFMGIQTIRQLLPVSVE